MVTRQRRRRIRVLGTYVRGELGIGDRLENAAAEKPA
jgi:hypothetical protein